MDVDTNFQTLPPATINVMNWLTGEEEVVDTILHQYRIGSWSLPCDDPNKLKADDDEEASSRNMKKRR